MNLIKIDNNEHKEILLNIFDFLIEVCKKHKILYFISSGTLLGAVRHKGFIPWDDDIDVMMPREDYTRFVSVIKKYNTIYEIFTPEGSKNYLYTYAKLCLKNSLLIEFPKGIRINSKIYIDIFPMDYLPENNDNSEKMYRLIKKYALANFNFRFYRNFNFLETNLVKKIYFHFKKKIYGFFPNDHYIIKIQNVLKNFKVENPKFIGMVIAGYGHREKMKIQLFQESTFLEFEGRLCNSPKFYDVYLSNLYGDYLKLPSIENQRKTHDNEAYLLY